MVALHDVHNDNANVSRNLKAVVAPMKARGVFADRKYKVGEIQLVPVTTSIVMKPVGADAPSGGLLVNKPMQNVNGVKLNVWLLGSGGVKWPTRAPQVNTGVAMLKEASKPMVSKYWLVKEDSTKANINMVTDVVEMYGLKIPILKIQARLTRAPS